MNYGPLAIAGLIALVPLIGCGRPSGLQRGSVDGAVTLDGTPVAKGSVRFVPMEGTAGPSAGAVIREGEYHVGSNKGPAVGKYRVEIYASRPTGKKIQDPLLAQKIPPPKKPNPDEGSQEADQTEVINLNPYAAGNLIDEVVESIPLQYNKHSTLELDVQAGRNTFDVHMESE